MTKINKLESSLRKILSPQNQFDVIIEKGNDGLLGFFKTPSTIKILASNVDNDIVFGAIIEEELRKQFGYGMFSKVHDKRTKQFESTYQPLKSFEPEKIMKTVSVSGTSTLHHRTTIIPRYRTPGPTCSFNNDES